MTLVMVVGFARAGSVVFWNLADAGPAAPGGQRKRVLPLAVACVLIGATAALAGFGGPVTAEFQQTAVQTLDTRGYARAVLGAGALPPQASR
jgi:multicomponent K+:H+ antiporter subunit D